MGQLTDRERKVLTHLAEGLSNTGVAQALYVKIDDLLKDLPQHAPVWPLAWLKPQVSDAELATLCVMQTLLRFAGEARSLRHAGQHLRHLFPSLPLQPGYNKRQRKLAVTLNWLIRQFAEDTSLWTDDVWGPIQPGRVRPLPRLSTRVGPGWMSRVRVLRLAFAVLLGLRLHLVATLQGLPVMFALTGAKADEGDRD